MPSHNTIAARRSPALANAGRLAAALGMLALAGCSGAISQSGPRTDDVLSGARSKVGNPGTPGNPRLDYNLVTLDQDNVALLAAEPEAAGFSPGIVATPESDVRIGVGDIIATTIFEAQSGGLFIPAEPGSRPGNYVQIPPQQVNRDGSILVPFGKPVQAVGLTPEQLAHAIEGRISGRALEPQAIVTIQDRRSNAVNVTGDVSSSVRFGVDPGGERLLGAVARAGGPRYPSYESMVTLQRGGHSERVLLADVLYDPRENVQLLQGDSVVITREPRYFLALGAVGQSASITQLNRRFPFEDRTLTMADAIARAGGLADNQANPAAVFLFRFERSEVLRQMGVNLAANAPARVPTVYRADFSNASTLFLSHEFPMHDADMIFVSNAPYTDWAKFLSIILPFAQSGANFRAFNP